MKVAPSKHLNLAHLPNALQNQRSGGCRGHGLYRLNSCLFRISYHLSSYHFFPGTCAQKHSSVGTKYVSNEFIFDGAQLQHWHVLSGQWSPTNRKLAIKCL